MMVRVNRRAFIGVSASALGFATTSRVVPTTSIEPYSVGTTEPILVMSVYDSNMAGFEWRWDFYFERLPNGTFRRNNSQIFSN